MQKTMARTAASDKTLCFLAFAGFILLVIEFLLGMLVNLFVSIPAPLPGKTLSNSGVLYGLEWSLRQTSMPLFLLHVGLGLLLVLISLALVVLALITRQGLWITVSLLAAVGIVIATLSGASFVDSGVVASSLVMSIAFLLALIAYAVGLYVTRPMSQFS